MATIPAMASEAIALAEKKMNMALDDIIKMSRKSSSFKARKPRASNKSERFPLGNASQGNSSKVQKYMDCASTLRQGVLAKRRSNFQGNQFPLAAEDARKASVAPIHNGSLISRNRVVNWNKPRVIAPRNALKNGLTQKVNTVPQQRPQMLKLMERIKNLLQQMEQFKQRMEKMEQQMARGENGRCQWQGRGKRAAAASASPFGGSDTIHHLTMVLSNLTMTYEAQFVTQSTNDSSVNQPHQGSQI